MHFVVSQSVKVLTGCSEFPRASRMSFSVAALRAPTLMAPRSQPPIARLGRAKRGEEVRYQGKGDREAESKGKVQAKKGGGRRENKRKRGKKEKEQQHRSTGVVKHILIIIPSRRPCRSLASPLSFIVGYEAATPATLASEEAIEAITSYVPSAVKLPLEKSRA